MANLQKFDAEIEKTRQTVEQMREKLDQSGIVWADAMTFALNQGNELFHVTLRDNLLAQQGTFDPVQVGATINEAVLKHFDRISMEEFKYLEKQISPATWVICLAAFLAVFGSIGVSFLMRVVDIGGSRGYRRFRRY